MRIAQIAPIIESVPPATYGGTERVIYELTEELTRRGHEVTLFASGDSLTSAKLISPYPKALRHTNMSDIYTQNPYTMMNISNAYSRQDKFDIIHDHTGVISAPTANLSQTPVVMTLHGNVTASMNQLFEQLGNINYVSISYSQKAPAPDLNYAGTVYNGLNMNDYPNSLEPEGYLLFVGRISEEKGVHVAIEVAEHLDLPLIIAAKLEKFGPDVDYFKKFIEPKLSEKIRWIGEVEEKQRNILMSKALAFLHPVGFREPFGLTLIEAMACGTPVVAFRRGSIPEIILDGKVGFVVEDSAEMIQAVKKINRINRESCKNYSRETFNAKRMADGYESIYQKVIFESQYSKFKKTIIDRVKTTKVKSQPKLLVGHFAEIED